MPSNRETVIQDRRKTYCGMETTMQDRRKIYGDYPGGATLRASLMRQLRQRYADVHKKPMHCTDESMLWDIVNKLTRLAVTPSHVDTWHDISTFAHLAELHYNGEPSDAS